MSGRKFLVGGDMSRALRRRSRYSVRPFFLVGFIVIALTLYSFALGNGGTGPVPNPRSSVQKRQEDAKEDLECRRVHHAYDQCAFVKANCPDEEAGMFSYLTLYYCRLPQAKPVAFTIIASWLALLFTTIGIAASDFFCINLATIANILHMSDNLAGVTFLAFGNGSPDIFSTFAAFSTNSGSLAIGELIGAASFITAVVAGSIAFIRPFKVPRKSFIRDVSFFIVAASFSLIFLFDGKLHLWECSVLVGLYASYVVFVLLWHMYFHRRLLRRRKEVAARAQFIVPGSEEADFGEDYHDEEEEATVAAHDRPALHRGSTIEDFATLERGEVEDEDEEEELEEVARAEITRNMRLSRPRSRTRALSHAPIRPSLVGALEFQAVLSDLQRSRNIHTMPIHLRRYSDDPRILPDDQRSARSEPRGALLPTVADDAGYEGTSANRTLGPGTRGRAVSTNDAETMGMNKDVFPQGVPKIDLLAPLPEDETSMEEAGPTSTAHESMLPPPSPTISLSPPPSTDGETTNYMLSSPQRTASPDRLAPPTYLSASSSAKKKQTAMPGSSKAPPPDRQLQALPKLSVPSQTTEQSLSSASSPTAAFPSYRDDPDAPSPRSSRASSIRIPPPSASPDSHFRSEFHFGNVSERPISWWPYAVLPPPRELFTTLFPTVDNWRDKNILQKCVGVLMIPSVFLLKVTLPVVETDREDSMDDDIQDLSLPGTLVSENARTTGRSPMATLEAASSSAVGPQPEQHNGATDYSKALSRNGLSAVAHASPMHPHQQEYFPLTTDDNIVQSPEQLPVEVRTSANKDWNRWLVIVQLFTAPLFVVFIYWANTGAEEPRALLRPTLISLLASLVALLMVLLTTTADEAPKWRVLLCFLGFAVSIAWISTIANEVVGVLKTIGVVLNISDAILGLTIFAVGNSCGDLVANVTVARLGFPNMALSACFGGPMLNILLGIGLSGMYLTIQRAQERAERGKRFKFKPYHIEVSRTLLISGATLLVTLLVLLVVVPLRRWKMDRFIGWALMAFWALSTVANVAVEVMGVAAKSSS